MVAANEIVALVPKTAKRNEGVIATLENMLVAARAETLTGVAVVAVDAEGCTHSAFEPGENLATLIGACARMQYRLLKLQGDD
jgi:hypothetical protein